VSIKENNNKRQNHLETVVSKNKVRKEKRKKNDERCQKENNIAFTCIVYET